MSCPNLSEPLRREIERDSKPVRPLPPPWRRAVWVVIAVGVVWLADLARAPLRPDLDVLPMAIGWGGALLQLAAGLPLVILALRQGVPGAGPSGGTCLAWFAAALVVQAAVAVATLAHSAGFEPGGGALGSGLACMAHDVAAAVPALLVTLWLTARALPTRAPLAGLLAGAGAGATADGLLHLLCPISDLGHVLVWHLGAIVLLAAAGAVLGAGWDRWRARRTGLPDR